MPRFHIGLDTDDPVRYSAVCIEDEEAWQGDTILPRPSSTWCEDARELPGSECHRKRDASAIQYALYGRRIHLLQTPVATDERDQQNKCAPAMHAFLQGGRSTTGHSLRNVPLPVYE